MNIYECLDEAVDRACKVGSAAHAKGDDVADMICGHQVLIMRALQHLLFVAGVARPDQCHECGRVGGHWPECIERPIRPAGTAS